MRYLLLGRLEAWAERSPVCLGPPRQRVLLASLLLQPGHTVSMEWLTDALWGSHPPRTARTKIHWDVSGLRKILGAAKQGAASPQEILVTHPAGYELRVLPGERDLDDFERLVADGQRLLAADPLAAADCLRAALGLWRGGPLEDLPLGPLLEAEVSRLDDRRLTVLEDRFGAELAAGLPPTHMVAELKPLIADHPLRERFRGLLMTALYACGRQAEALALFSDTRRALIDQLGIEPGTELQRLHRDMLAGIPIPGFRAPHSRLRASDAQPQGKPSHATSGRAPVPAQLPHTRTDFTGRNAELAQLDAWLTAMSSTGGAVPVFVLTGEAGAGKTALAVQFAHQIADRFPDGQLFIDLHGSKSGNRTLKATQALAYVLRSLGVSQRSEARIDEQAAVYRSLLVGKRLLLLLDDTRSSQVQPLLPGAPGSMVLVTSRDRMADVVIRDSARRLTVTAMSATDAISLLAHIIGEQRVAAEPAAAAAVARLCGYLPLPLAVAGERADGDPWLSLADLASELARNGCSCLATERASADRADVPLRAAVPRSRPVPGPSRRPA
jgi:DNA-binding SARP family transcriptional activator